MVLAFWPLATAGAATDPSVQPWVWYLLNVATAAAVMAFEVVLQIVWAVLVPLYAAVRLTQIDAMPWAGANPAQTVGIVLDAVFALILAGVIIALGWMLRGTAVGIDRARRDAVASYAAAAEADAVETERVAVAALMHDSVLAALIAAERARRPAKKRSRCRWRGRRSRGSRTPSKTWARVSMRRCPRHPSSPASARGGRPRSRSQGAGRARPRRRVGAGAVARAIVLAATQAVANAVQHASPGPVVSVRADPATISVQVSDAGAGPARVGARRPPRHPRVDRGAHGRCRMGAPAGRRAPRARRSASTGTVRDAAALGSLRACALCSGSVSPSRRLAVGALL